MKKYIVALFLLLALSCQAALITNVQRLSTFGIVNSMSSTDYVAVGVYSNGFDRLRGIPASQFFGTAGSNTLLAITNFVKAQNTIVSNGVVTLIINTSNSLFTVSTIVSNGVIQQLLILSNYVNLASSNRVVVLPDTNTTVVVTSTNGVIYYAVSSTASGGGFDRLRIDTNGVIVGLGTNISWTYGITGSVAGATFTLGVDDSFANSSISNGVIQQLLVLSNNISSALSSFEVKTNGVSVGFGTNFNFTTGVTGYLSGSTLTLGVNSSSTLGIGTTNFLNLSVQAAKLPNTNYPGIDAGWQSWELVYYETNDIGTRTTLNSTFQFLVPPDYATNTMRLRIMSTLLTTNGPNTSNTIFQASCLRAASGSGIDLHTNLFGTIAKGTNTWSASFDGTNKVQVLVIDLGTNSMLAQGDLAILKLGREAATDTFDGPTAVVGLQLEYTRP